MLALTKERNVYTWGSGGNGRLGHGDETSYSEPRAIDILIAEEVIFIAAGINNSAAINSRGVIFCWGNSKFGKLGK